MTDTTCLYCNRVLNYKKATQRFCMGHGKLYFKQQEDKMANKVTEYWKCHALANRLFKKESCEDCNITDEVLTMYSIGSHKILEPANWLTLCSLCKGKRVLKEMNNKWRD